MNTSARTQMSRSMPADKVLENLIVGVERLRAHTTGSPSVAASKYRAFDEVLRFLREIEVAP